MNKQLLLLTAASLFVIAPVAQQQLFGIDAPATMVMKEDKIIISDADLIAAVKKVLSEDKDFSKFLIVVTADKGLVTLTGKVDSVKDKLDIGSKVKAVEGVRDLINNLEVAS